MGLVPSAEPEVLDGLLVHGAESHGGSVLGSHVGDGGPVREAQVLVSGSVELHELSDDTLLPEHVDDGEDQVGCGDTGAELAGEPESDDIGQLHVAGLSDHDGLGLDSTDSPSDDSESVDLGGVGVCTEAGVGVRCLDTVLLLDVDEGRQVLQVDLVADTVSGGNGAEVLEGPLGPLEEGVPLLVPLEVELLVELERIVPSSIIRVDGVVDDQVHGDEGVDELGVLAHGLDGVPHGCQVGDGGSTGKVLEEDPCGDPRDVAVGVLDCVPGCCGEDILIGDDLAIPLPEHGLDEDLDGIGHLGEVLDDTFLLQLPKAVYLDLTLCGLDRLLAFSDFCHEIPLGLHNTGYYKKG